MTSDSSEVLYSKAGNIARITINRPGRMNALNSSAIEALARAFIDAGEDLDIRAVVVTGVGDKAFSSGLDLKELDSMAKKGNSIPMPMEGLYRNLFELVLETFKPTIAAINGLAVGGGCELALACDLRIAANEAYLALPEAKRGMGANFASVLLPRLIPRALALEMLYTGDSITADAAQQIGLINKSVPRAMLHHEVEELASRIATNAPLSLRRYKEMTTKGWELPIGVALRLNVGPNPYVSEDREEGVRAFVEKRPPQWSGR